MAKKSLDELLEAAYSEEGISREDILASKGFISTGNLAFDFIFSGGLARGRSYEFYGPSQSAKTTAALEAAVCCQAAGGVVVYIDFEQALDTAYMRSVGVNVNNRKLFKPYPAATLEKGMNFARAAVDTGEVGLIIFDSVPAMVPESAANAEGDQSRTMAMERARLLGGAIGALNPALARTGATAIFINHERDVIDTSGMPQRGPKRTTTAGGTALKFYASGRAQFRTVKKFNAEREDPISGEKIKVNHSQLTKITVTKNKVGSPEHSAEIYVEFGKGFNNTWSALSVLIAAKVCTRSGAFVRFPESLYHGQMNPNKNGKGGQLQGIPAVLALAEFDPEWAARMAKAATDLLSTREVVEIGPDIDAGGEDPDPSPLDEISDTDSGVETPAFVPKRAPAEAPTPEPTFEPAPASTPAADTPSVDESPSVEAEEGWEANPAPEPDLARDSAESSAPPSPSAPRSVPSPDATLNLVSRR